MFETIIFFLFAGLAIGCAISVVYHKNPLYSAISLIGVFISLAGLYLTLAAPFIAAVQILIYAGAIMVLVVFVIMLLNLEDDHRQPNRLRYLYVLGGVLESRCWHRRSLFTTPSAGACKKAAFRATAANRSG